MPSFLAGLSRAGRILVINRAVHNYFLLILEWISPATSGTEKTQLLNMSFIMIILVSQMCKKQNFHLSLLTMQQQQQYIVSKARYLSYFTGYWVKYNWLSCLFVLFSDYEQEEVQRLLWIPGINLDEKHPCTCPRTVKRTYHLRDVQAALSWMLVGNCGWELLLGACKWIFQTMLLHKKSIWLLPNNEICASLANKKLKWTTKIVVSNAISSFGRASITVQGWWVGL